ncbi:CACTA en-spm transposon protein [Cucumis melo var. makuwa]|uniref:CACTA en-spm transposon protein n=1 Tax=Cucumis melo var. makuwa TaxID=1194695 RepID=A0A5A7UPN4_CUCMM|nr:CACTA en-spm transposon protein [Cucumis melo var. makuwa]TYK05223.1 CACTA en-spm transposon protein [Cucumis melo var. makuwa]
MCSSTIPSSFYEAKQKLRDLSLEYETIHAYGFNPFGQMSTSYNIWHVVLLPYNLPPWKYMKETNFFISLLIPGPRSPGREIDVYLQPLIEELKELWTFGVRMYDSLTDQFFQLYAALLWTINDFPTYGDLSGWSIKGYQACHICVGDRSSFRIRGRISFMKYRRYLPENNVWRRSNLHDGKVEHKAPLVVTNEHEILEQLDRLELCVMSPTTSSMMWMNTCHMQATTTNYNDKPRIMSLSYPRHNFLETDAMFLEFEDELDNFAGGSSSVGNNTGESSSQQSGTPTPRRRAQSQLLELEHHVATIGVCVRKTSSIHCLKWADVHREYIEVVKGDLQFFVLNFNDQVMNRFVEHQMLTIFKNFRADYHKHFKKYSNPDEARASPSNILEQSRTNEAGRQEQPYNHSSGSKSFLQRQHELAEQKGELVDRVELFQETHVRVNQMLELQSQPTPEGSQPFFGDEICDQVLGRRPCYSKGLGWGPKSKAFRRGLPDVGDFVSKNGVGRGILDVERGIPDAVLVTHQECLSRLTSPDVRPDAPKNVGISFPDVFFYFP